MQECSKIPFKQIPDDVWDTVNQKSFFSYEKQALIEGAKEEEIKSLNKQLSVGINHMKKEIKRCEKLESSLISKFTTYQD